MAWFARDHTGRALSDRERGFLAALTNLLAELRLPQLDENETALDAELTHCLIALMPHRSLGGISLVIGLTAERAGVSWAQVAGLGCCHDSLDAGISVANVRVNGDDFRPLLELIRHHLQAPLTIEILGADRAVVAVRDWKGKRRRVGELGRPARGMERWRSGKPTRVIEVRLTDVAKPPFAEPSGVDEWFTARH